MLKKFFGSLFAGAAASKEAAPVYDVPAVLPALDPDMQAVTSRMKLPDSIKRHLDPAAVVSPAAAAGEAATDAGGALAAAAGEAAGDSVPFLGALLKDPRFALISAKFLAFGLKKEAAILWAAEAATLGYSIRHDQTSGAAAPMSPAESAAVAQAQAFAGGGDFSAEAAAAAAREAGLDKPGGLAAQAAAWTADPPPVDPDTAAELTGNAVSGAVLLAAALTIPELQTPAAPAIPVMAAAPAPPPELPSMPLLVENADDVMPMAKALKPFIDKGLEIAAMGA